MMDSKFTPKVAKLLQNGETLLPLTKAGNGGSVVLSVELQDAGVLFPGARAPQAALAGLLLRLGWWEEAHNVAQDVADADGSYWHAIIHRMEPDASNASYWFRRVGRHSIFPDLQDRAAQAMAHITDSKWKLPASWDPEWFLAMCENARRRPGSPLEDLARNIQQMEWELLFLSCAGPAK